MNLDLVSPKREYVVKLKRPHPKQENFVSDRIKRKIIRAGRRGGKTTGVAILAVKCFLAGKRVLYAAPTVDQVGRFWNEVKIALADPIERGVIVKNESTHTIEMPGTDIRIKAKTAWNADTLRGDYADILILDEWQLMNEDAWELVGVPMLLDNDGDAAFIYTPPSLKSRSVTKARDPRHAAKMFKKALADKTGRWRAYSFTSHDNPHLSRKALKEIVFDMTTLAYRQEIMAEDVDEAPGALWKMKWIDEHRVDEAPELERIVVAIDPSGNRGEADLDEAGIVVAGRSYDWHGYLLRDDTTRGTPKEWATAAIEAYKKFQCDCIIAEKNNGGEMVRHTIHSVDSSVPVILVHATRGKAIRAEPISVHSQMGLIHHVGTFSKLEDELTMWIQGSDSPNRLDAFVWAFTELFPREQMLEIHGGGADGGPEARQMGNQTVDESVAQGLRNRGVFFPRD